MAISGITQNNLDAQELADISSFFDLLARFDYEDKQKEKLVLNPDTLAIPSKKSGLGTKCS